MLSLLRQASCLSHDLQFDRFDFGDEALFVVSQEPTDDVEHGVTEATDVHDVSSLASLRCLIRLDVDANKLWVRVAAGQLALVGYEGFPGRQHTG